MNFEPQIPEWGLDDFKNHQDKLFEYHEWLKNTAIKTGLISKKTDQFIWDEFIIHSLYFAKLIKKFKNLSECEIIDLGTGAGIPGIPISIVNKTNVSLVDNKQKRIYELERLVKILNLNNAKPIKKDAKTILNKNAAATPQAIIFLLFSVANPAAIKPIMIALSAAITISMRIICTEIITCSNIRESMYIRLLRYIKE